MTNITTPLAPTDAELDALIDQHRWDATTGRRAIARAVLARWGTPAPVGVGEVVAWVDERAIGWLKNSRAHSATITTTLGKAKSSERPMPLHGTPQPTQPQAGAVPLTDEQSHALLHRMADECDKWADGLSYEPTREQASGWCVAFLMRELPAHGIKGGQHGTE